MIVPMIGFGQCLSGDCENGYGTVITENGEYKGEWKNNMIHGKGTFTWNNGDEYVGEFRENKKNGQGTFTYANGNKYVG